MYIYIYIQLHFHQNGPIGTSPVGESSDESPSRIAEEQPSTWCCWWKKSANQFIDSLSLYPISLQGL